jgi:hypothetical protein
MWYGPFEVFDKVGYNLDRLNIPPYMWIYSIVNVENLELYEPSMLDQEEEKILPIIGNLAPYSQAELVDNTIWYKRSITT